jgi:hypothetical protein
MTPGKRRWAGSLCHSSLSAEFWPPPSTANTATSAANSLRGCPSVDHLVGDGEQPWRHFDAVLSVMVVRFLRAAD